VGIEIGSMAADIAGDLGAAPNLCPAEKDVMLEHMDQAVRFRGLILGAGIDGSHDVDERKVMPFIEKDLHPVVESELFLNPFFFGEGGSV
jgi:hypothetical protein